MSDPNAHDAQLQRLRQWRTRPDRDVSMAFIEDQFKREVTKPHKQVNALAELWEQLVPDDLRQQTRLESLTRGVLKVCVESSAVRFELDRLLRDGLERELITRCTGPVFRRIRLQVGPIDPPPRTT